MIITPRGVEPLLKQFQGTVSPDTTTSLTSPLEESRDTVTRYNYSLLMPEICLVTLPLLLVYQDRLQTLLQAFLDMPKLLQLLDLSESI